MSLPPWIQLLVMPMSLHMTCDNGGHSIDPGDTFAFIDNKPMCRDCLAMFNGDIGPE